MFHRTTTTTNTHLPLTRKETLDASLRSRSIAPVVLARDDYDALDVAAREDYNAARMAWLSHGILVATPALQKAQTTLRKIMLQNSRRSSGHLGLMISGDSTLGKTTMSEALMKNTYTLYAKQFPDFQRTSQVPVVAIDVPAGCTGKLLMIAFADFFGLDYRRIETADAIRLRVVDALIRADTELIVVDELHNLSAANRGNGESVDILKALHNAVPATFVYLGINLNNGALLAGERGQQLSGRFSRIDLTRYNQSSPDEARTWREIIRAFETKLPLADHTTGTLKPLAAYLHDRTGGSIGSLGRLLTGAAMDLVLTDDTTTREEITLEQLDKQLLDMAAETHFASRPAHKNSITQKAA